MDMSGMGDGSMCMQMGQAMGGCGGCGGCMPGNAWNAAWGGGLGAWGGCPMGYTPPPTFAEAKKAMDQAKQQQALSMKRGGPNMASAPVVMDEQQAKRFQEALKRHKAAG